MTDEETQQPMGGVPTLGEAGEPDPERGVERTEGGRPHDFEPSPEGRLMRGGTVTTSNPASLPPDMDRTDLEQIDAAAADAAANDVRRREHSAD